MKIVIITGLSGAGKSTTLKIFEDMGYYCMDNLPPSLIQNFVELSQNSNKIINRLAVVVDLRGGVFLNDLDDTIKVLKENDHDVSMIYLEAKDNILIRRYKELRRPHPLGDNGDLPSGIEKEKQIMERFKLASTYIIDTSNMRKSNLIKKLDFYYGSENKNKILININSFGFKHGILENGDLIFDVRFLENPFYVKELKELSGKDEAVKTYVNNLETTQIFIDKTMDLLLFLIPEYILENKLTLDIGIGCTGGKHRSVVVAERLKDELTKKGYSVSVMNRDEHLW